MSACSQSKFNELLGKISGGSKTFRNVDQGIVSMASPAGNMPKSSPIVASVGPNGLANDISNGGGKNGRSPGSIGRFGGQNRPSGGAGLGASSASLDLGPGIMDTVIRTSDFVPDVSKKTNLNYNINLLKNAYKVLDTFFDAGTEKQNFKAELKKAFSETRDITSANNALTGIATRAREIYLQAKQVFNNQVKAEDPAWHQVHNNRGAGGGRPGVEAKSTSWSVIKSQIEDLSKMCPNYNYAALGIFGANPSFNTTHMETINPAIRNGNP